MPRPKFNTKYGKLSNNNNKLKKKWGRNIMKTHKKSSEYDRKSKKYKFIRRNQDNEEALRRQQRLEKVSEEKNSVENRRQVNELDYSSDDDNQNNAFDQLISTFGNACPENLHINYATESNDESFSDETVSILKEGEDVDTSDCDDDPEIFEEQSKPRGKKYRSSENEEEEEKSEDDGKQSDSLDYIVDAENTMQNSKPEGLEIKSHSDDFFGTDYEIESENSEFNDYDDGSSDDNQFDSHLKFDLSPQLLDCMTTTHTVREEICCWPILGRILVEIPSPYGIMESVPKKKCKLPLLEDEITYAKEGTVPILYNEDSFDLEKAAIKVQLRPNIMVANKSNIGNSEEHFTKLQLELFSIMNNYQDLFYSNRNHFNGEEIRFIYTLHAVNHIMKTRTKILNHNLKLKTMGLTSSDKTEIISDQYRDQGLFRPKVLIVVPFRESVLRIVKILTSLLYPSAGKEGINQKSHIMHYKRFLEEYGGETLNFPKKNPKPEDYEHTFAGNSDDKFRIGITFTRKCLKLYSDFYSADILIVSPLGLRMIVGAPGDKERDYDFLASIEVLILDQADVFLAQNWDHLLHVLDHLHLQPRSARDTDFSRVRSWCLNGWSRFYRQTLLFSSHELAEFRSLFNSRCSNYRGKIRMLNPIESGTIKHVAVKISQSFHRIDVSSIQSSFDQRFDYFIKTILPQFKAASKAHCLIYIPSYFDFVRIRNYFKTETLSFTQICEYTKVCYYYYMNA